MTKHEEAMEKLRMASKALAEFRKTMGKPPIPIEKQQSHIQLLKDFDDAHLEAARTWAESFTLPKEGTPEFTEMLGEPVTVPRKVLDHLLLCFESGFNRDQHLCFAFDGPSVDAMKGNPVYLKCIHMHFDEK